MSGPVALPVPMAAARRVSVKSALGCARPCWRRCPAATCSSAWRRWPTTARRPRRSTRSRNRAPSWAITLTPNPDILAEVVALPNPPFCVGFAAESRNNLDEYAEGKRKAKEAADGGRQPGAGRPGGDDNQVVLFDRRGGPPSACQGPQTRGGPRHRRPPGGPLLPTNLTRSHLEDRPMHRIDIRILDERLKLRGQPPAYATSGSAGLDLLGLRGRAAGAGAGPHRAGAHRHRDPPGRPGPGGDDPAALGLGRKHGIVPGNLVGLIDSDYQGQIFVSPDGTAATSCFTIQPLERIAQLVVVPVLQGGSGVVESFRREQATGAAGFGSTGKH